VGTLVGTTPNLAMIVPVGYWRVKMTDKPKVDEMWPPRVFISCIKVKVSARKFFFSRLVHLKLKRPENEHEYCRVTQDRLQKLENLFLVCSDLTAIDKSLEEDGLHLEPDAYLKLCALHKARENCLTSLRESEKEKV
jgi:hypothetical protein